MAETESLWDTKTEFKITVHLHRGRFVQRRGYVLGRSVQRRDYVLRRSVQRRGYVIGRSVQRRGYVLGRSVQRRGYNSRFHVRILGQANSAQSCCRALRHIQRIMGLFHRWYSGQGGALPPVVQLPGNENGPSTCIIDVNKAWSYAAIPTVLIQRCFMTPSDIGQPAQLSRSVHLPAGQDPTVHCSFPTLPTKHPNVSQANQAKSYVASLTFILISPLHLRLSLQSGLLTFWFFKRE
jgi:hypothetical protein